MTATTTGLVIRTAADLEVGDILHRSEIYSVLVTRLNPPTREEALACGLREVWSLSSVWTYDADESVNASPGEHRLALLAERAEVSA